MPPDRPSSLHALLSGRQRGWRAAALRGALRCAEPFYASAASLRNFAFDRHLRPARRLRTPVLSVGNITTGGTGKTPVVQWLATAMRAAGFNPAILMRGYRATRGAPGDEQDLLAEAVAPIPVHADPDRLAGAHAVLHDRPDVNLFILDDGFQHRQLRRDVDLVLIDATNPFGYGHVLPRGLLREPVGGLVRASAFILTRSDLVDRAALQDIEQILRSLNRTAPIYRARHVIGGLRTAGCAIAGPPDLPIEHLREKRYLAFAGIANPDALHRQLARLPGHCADHHWFADHHAFMAENLAEMRRRAGIAGAAAILVTEKDWRKLRHLPGAGEGNPPLLRLDLRIEFDHHLDRGLLQFIHAELDRATTGSPQGDSRG